MCVNELRDGVRRKGRAARKGKNSFRSNDSERLYQLVRGIDCNTHTHTQANKQPGEQLQTATSPSKCLQKA